MVELTVRNSSYLFSGSSVAMIPKASIESKAFHQVGAYSGTHPDVDSHQAVAH
jgi:hypothetical protein